MSNQERRLMRRMQSAQSGGGMMEARANRGALLGPDPDYIREQQDRERTRLAERLLEIGLEDTRAGEFTDCHRREPVTKEGGEVAYHEDVATLTVEEWFVKLANASMSAAEVIYPELPSDVDHGNAATLSTLPAAAQEGARTVDTWDATLRPGEVIVDGATSAARGEG